MKGMNKRKVLKGYLRDVSKRYVIRNVNGLDTENIPHRLKEQGSDKKHK